MPVRGASQDRGHRRQQDPSLSPQALRHAGQRRDNRPRSFQAASPARPPVFGHEASRHGDRTSCPRAEVSRLPFCSRCPRFLHAQYARTVERTALRAGIADPKVVRLARHSAKARNGAGTRARLATVREKVLRRSSPVVRVAFGGVPSHCSKRKRAAERPLEGLRGE